MAEKPQRWLLIEAIPRIPGPRDKILLADGTVRALGFYGQQEQIIVIDTYSDAEFVKMLDERVSAEIMRQDFPEDTGYKFMDGEDNGKT